jgi:uncharacterized protein (DUF1499 family)
LSENSPEPADSDARPKKRGWRIAVLGILILLGVLILGNWFAGKPSGLGAENGRLAACPDSPNCVSSQEDREPYQVSALKYEGDGKAAFARLKELVENQPRTEVVTQTEKYLHAEVTTAVLRFVDDLEFLLAEDEKVIHVRSASRIGHADMGTNRKRVEALRSKFESAEENQAAGHRG